MAFDENKQQEVGEENRDTDKKEDDEADTVEKTEPTSDEKEDDEDQQKEVDDNSSGGVKNDYKTLASIPIFLPYVAKLNEFGISTTEEFLSMAESNKEGISSLLEIDIERLNELIDIVKKKVSKEKLDMIEKTEIKEIGKDYMLGDRYEGGDEDAGSD